MTSQPPVDPPCNTVVYRTIRRKEWFDPDNDLPVKAEAFMRRRPKVKPDGTPDSMDEDGLSVYDSLFMNVDACIADPNCRRGFGVASLHVGTLRDLGLTVIRDPEDDKKLLITDVPFENPGTADEEALLDDVADSARIVSRQSWKRQ